MLALVKGDKTTHDTLLNHFVQSFKQAQAEMDVAQKAVTQADTQLAQKRSDALKLQGQLEFIASQMRQAWERVESNDAQDETHHSAA